MIDLIEIHVHGGPWSQGEAELIGRQVCAAIEQAAGPGGRVRRAVPAATRSPVTDVYVADCRGEEPPPEEAV